MQATMLLLATSNGVGVNVRLVLLQPPPPPPCLTDLPPFPHRVKNQQRFRVGSVPHNCFTHPDVLRHLFCLHLHLHPLNQNLLLARDAIINPPVVGVKRRRDGGG